MNEMIGLIFTIVGVVLAAVGIILAIYVIPRRRLSTYVISFDSTLQVTDAVRGRVEIRYNKRKVNSLQRMRILLQNTGNRAITKKDIVEPIRLSLRPPAKIVNIKKRQSTLMGYSLKRSDNRVVQIQFELMNAKEFLALELLIADTESVALWVTGRGTDLVIPKVKDIRERGIWDLLLASITTIVSIIAINIFIFFTVTPVNQPRGLDLVGDSLPDRYSQLEAFKDMLTTRRDMLIQVESLPNRQQLISKANQDIEQVSNEISQIKKQEDEHLRLLGEQREKKSTTRLILKWFSLGLFLLGVPLTVFLVSLRWFRRRRLERYFLKDIE